MESITNISKEVEELISTGFFIKKRFANEEHCDKISQTLKISPANIFNCNELIATKISSTIFNKYAIATSKEAFDIVTNPILLEIAEKFIGTSPILKCSRSYSISKFDPSFEWHSDNKDINNVIDHSKGIVFILFLEDDEEGSFSLIKDTKNFPDSLSSLPTVKQIDYWTRNQMIKKIFAKKGDLIGFSQDIFHRHITETKNSLNAFWFQVIGENAGIGERVLLNPSFLEEKNQTRILKYFSSKNKRIDISFPISTTDTINFSSNVKYLFILIFKLPRSFVKSLRSRIIKLMPFSIINRIKK